MCTVGRSPTPAYVNVKILRVKGACVHESNDSLTSVTPQDRPLQREAQLSARSRPLISHLSLTSPAVCQLSKLRKPPKGICCSAVCV